VVRGQNNVIYYRLFSLASRTWGAWAVLPSGTTTDTPAAVLFGNQLHIVVRGTNSTGIYYGYLDFTTNVFSGWTVLSGATPSTPTLCCNGTRLCLSVRGMDNRIYYRLLDLDSRTWLNWGFLQVGATGEGVGVAFTGNNLQVVTRDMATNQMWHTMLDPNTGTISTWTLLTGATPSRATLTS
jgi:hypothetical protein